MTSKLELKRDQYGRPLVPDPTTGKVKAWTRVTTLANTLSDRFALEQWQQRNIVRGMAARENLLVRAAAAGDDRDQLTAIVKDALEAAQASSAADIGTALHSLTEQIDSGEDPAIPKAYQADIKAYLKALENGGVTIEPGWIERFVVVQSLGAAGTPDRLVRVEGYDKPIIGDLKTGANAVKYSQVEIAAQLAVYAHADHYWDGEKHYRMPAVDQERALVIHMPAGQGTCELHWVDIEVGWAIALDCHKARDTRKLKPFAPFARAVTHDEAIRNLEEVLPVEEVVEKPPREILTNLPSIRNRAVRAGVDEIKGKLGDRGLPLPWPTSVKPPSRQGDAQYDDRELKVIEGWISEIRQSLGLTPF